MTTTTYSFKKGLLKTLVHAFIWGLPLLVQLLPSAWMNLTLSGVLTLIVNYLKIKAAQAA